MEITKKNINGIVHTSDNLFIPFYQREYSWRKKEVLKFLQDILKSESKNYYIGSLVLKNKGTSKIIIDGQQRMTTIWLIIKVLSSYSKNNQDFLEFLKYFNYQNSHLNNSETMNKIMKEENPIYTDDEKKSSFYENFQTIKFFLNDISETELFDKQFEKVTVAYILADKEVDEHILFAQINSTGKKLTAFDLMKNFLFSLFNHSINQDELEGFIKEKITLLMHISDYLKQDKKDDLIRQFIAFKTNILVNNETEKIYEAFNNLFSETPQETYYKITEAQKAFDDFYKFGLIYKYLINEDWGDKPFSPSMKLLIESANTYMCLLIDIFDKHSEFEEKNLVISKEQEKQIQEILLVLEYYKITREFYNFKDKTLTRYIPKLVKDITNCNFDLNYQSKLYLFIAINANKKNNDNNKEITYRMPTSQEFKVALSNNNIYKTSKFCKRFIIRIGSYNDKTKIDFTNFNIEHILPQNLNKWIANGYNENPDEVLQKKETIGNLTLTPSGYNSEYSNKIWEEKKELIIENEGWKFNKYFYNLSEWNIQKILIRSEHIFRLTQEIWNFSKIENSIKFFSDQNKEDIS